MIIQSKNFKLLYTVLIKRKINSYKKEETTYEF